MNGSEEFELGQPSAAPEPGSTTRRERRRARPSPWVVTAVALVVAGVVAAPPAALLPRAEPDGIAWNVLDIDLRSEPEPLWQAGVSVTGVIGVTARTLVVESSGLFHTHRILHALDLDTGHLRWSLADPERTCQLGSTALVCVRDRGGPDAVVATVQPSGATRTIELPGALAGVDIGDGEGLVAIVGDVPELAHLVRLDEDGAEVWRTQLTISGRADVGFTGLALTDDGVVTASGYFDLATGDLSGMTTPVDDTAADGAVRTVRDDGSTLVSTPAGGERVVPSGELWLTVDDSFGGQVSLTRANDDDDILVRPADADEGWRLRSTPLCWPVARLAGTLLQWCTDVIGTSTIAYDLSTGERLWQRGEPGGWLSPMIASPDTLLMTTDDGVAGLDPRTGLPRWSIPVPGSYVDAIAVGGTVLVWSDEVLVRLL